MPRLGVALAVGAHFRTQDLEPEPLMAVTSVCLIPMHNHRLQSLVKDWEKKQEPTPFPITVEALPGAEAAEEVLCPTREGVVAMEAPAMIQTF